MEPITQSLCVLIVSVLSLCGGATEYYVRPSEPTNTSCPAQPCLTLNEYARNSESYFTTSNIVFKFLPGTHLVNTSISVRNVHNVSFTSLERKKTPQIIFYKWSQCKNVSCDQLATGMCTPFGFWNATSVNIDRLGVLVYPQNKPVYCMHLLGIAFTNVSQLHLHHCNITVVCRTIRVYNTYSKTCGLCYSVHLKDSEFARVMFSTISCYQGRLYLLKSKNTEIANSIIVGGVTVSDSTIAIIRGCSLRVEEILVLESRNISLSEVFVHFKGIFIQHLKGISIQHTNHTRIANVTLFNCSGTGLDLLQNIDTQVLNATILFSSTGISIAQSSNITLQDVGLWRNKKGISLTQVVTVNINNVFVSGSTYRVFYAYRIKSLHSVKNLTVVNWTRISLYLLHTKNVTLQNLTIESGTVQTSQMEYSQGLISLSHNITIENTLFSGSTSHSTTTDITQQPAVLETYMSQVQMENCSFETNNSHL